MTANGKAAAGETLDASYAAIKLEHAAALIAMEVVVVCLAGALIDSCASGQLNRGKPAFFDQRFDVPVDGCDAQPFDLGLRRIEHLLGRQWPVGSLECVPDRCALPGISLIFFNHLPADNIALSPE